MTRTTIFTGFIINFFLVGLAIWGWIEFAKIPFFITDLFFDRWYLSVIITLPAVIPTLNTIKEVYRQSAKVAQSEQLDRHKTFDEAFSSLGSLGIFDLIPGIRDLPFQVRFGIMTIFLTFLITFTLVGLCLLVYLKLKPLFI